MKEYFRSVVTILLKEVYTQTFSKNGFCRELTRCESEKTNGTGEVSLPLFKEKEKVEVKER